jgi:hypothetical protein
VTIVHPEDGPLVPTLLATATS